MFINYIIFALKKLNINLTQNIQITLYYVKLTLGYIKNLTQKF